MLMLMNECKGWKKQVANWPVLILSVVGQSVLGAVGVLESPTTPPTIRHTPILLTHSPLSLQCFLLHILQLPPFTLLSHAINWPTYSFSALR